MPTYSYKCTVCDVAFDIQQSFTDSSLTECPTCSGKLRKLFSAVGVTFNGSGFYRNDSRKTEKSSAGKAEKTVSSPSTAGSSGGSSTGTSTATPS
ncbi:FmdB family transcriptional regulator [Mycetocola manganoxydans]|uniref:FmdB family transcriptional regulator n=1 Tax=Mycetocola manganoxydans TaxID=699879 RepID=A0A3L6ZWK9_9MICO|nr:FmdB family zinc ribbon protein [Mycetocola manganoxydans]RLP72144.1 FmdB family transcriptional regulator [Mycetocola manganoxydans]GHD52313.1 hypothetical protein GCM10008097_28060 [Mycetocola manganoxydans]